MKRILVLLLVFMPFTIFAQQINFKGKASAETVEVGEQFTVTYTIEGADPSGFERPDLGGLQYLGEAEYETAVRANGELQVKKTINYYLAALRPGTYTIEPAQLTVRNRTFQSNPVTITVTDGAGGAANIPPQQSERDLPLENVFIRATLDKSEAYVGEQVLLTYKLYTRHNIRNYTPPTTNYNGFWKKDVQISRPQLQKELVNGMVYNTAILHQVVLFPQVTGNITIAPAEMTASVETSFFRMRSVNLESNSTSLSIWPLPEQGKPESFKGAVGNFNIASSVSSSSITTDDPVTVSVKISGTGNISLIEAPTLPFPVSWEVYEPEASEDTDIRGGRLTGSKTFNYLAIPGEAGRLEPQSIEFSYFDPQLERYITRSSVIPEITVNQGTGTKAKVSETEEMPGIYTGDVNLKNSSRSITTSPIFYSLLALPFLIFLPLFYYKKNKDIQATDEKKSRDSKAKKVFHENAEKAKEAMAMNENKLFYAHLLKAINEYLLQKYALSIADLSKTKLHELLISKNIDEKTTNDLLYLINKGEEAVYAPTSGISDMRSDLEKSENIVATIENL